MCSAQMPAQNGIIHLQTPCPTPAAVDECTRPVLFNLFLGKAAALIDGQVPHQLTQKLLVEIVDRVSQIVKTIEAS